MKMIVRKYVGVGIGVHSRSRQRVDLMYRSVILAKLRLPRARIQLIDLLKGLYAR